MQRVPYIKVGQIYSINGILVKAVMIKVFEDVRINYFESIEGNKKFSCAQYSDGMICRIRKC